MIPMDDFADVSLVIEDTDDSDSPDDPDDLTLINMKNIFWW